jgi:hypothetical protein
MAQNGINEAENINPQWLAIIELLNDPFDNRTIEQKCKAADVPKRTLYHWMKNSDFNQLREQMLAVVMDIEEGTVQKSMLTQVKRGNVQAMRLYYELKGKIKTKMEHTGANGGPIQAETKIVFNMAAPPPKRDDASDPDLVDITPVEDAATEATAEVMLQGVDEDEEDDDW